MSLKVGDRFNSYAEFEVAYKAFCTANNVKFITANCDMIDSYYRRAGRPAEAIRMGHLKFLKIAYQCFRPNMKMNGPNRSHKCDAGLRLRACPRTCQLILKKLELKHSSTCLRNSKWVRSKSSTEKSYLEYGRSYNTLNQALESEILGIDDGGFSPKNDNEIIGEDKNSSGIFTLSNDGDVESDFSFGSYPVSEISEMQQKDSTHFDEAYSISEDSKVQHTAITPIARKTDQQQSPQDLKVSDGAMPLITHISGSFSESSQSYNMPIISRKFSQQNNNLISATEGRSSSPPNPSYESADSLFFSSICAEVQSLPRDVKNDLKLWILEKVNKTIRENSK